MARNRRADDQLTQIKLDELKLQLSLEVKKAIHRGRWTQKEAAFHLGTSRSCIHLVETLKIDKLTLGQLLFYLIRSDPKFQLMIALR